MIDCGQFISWKHSEFFIKYLSPVDYLPYATNNASSLSLKLKHVLLKNNDHISFILTKDQYSVVIGISLSLSLLIATIHVLVQAPTEVVKSAWISLLYW